MALVRNASILFVCTMAGNFSNYCFQFLMGRQLSLDDYGTMNALLSVVTSITLPAGAIMIVLAKYSSIYSVKNKEAAMGSLYAGSLKRIGAAAIAAALLFMSLSWFIKDYLRVAEISSVLLLAIGIFGSFIMAVNLGLLQGMQRFYYLGVGIGLGGILRLLLGAVFILIGFGLNGAIAATVLPSVFIFLITLKPLKAYLNSNSASFRHEGIFKYSVPVLASSVAFAFLSNIDLIMIKHYFTPEAAGLYSSVAVLGKTLLYLPSSFALAVFPMVTEADAINGDFFKILDKALIFAIGLCSAGVFVFALVPELIISLLFGARFSEAAEFLKYYGAAMSFMAVLSILISFNLARNKTGFIYSLGAGSLLMVSAIALFHSNIKEVLISITAVLLLTAAFNLWLVYRDRQEYYRLRDCGLCRTDEPGAGFE
ncbi:MAG: oligosaccharide flippase family protein [Deltaproteobacteria bacterium]|nr:oligosaccharide flippase family protein [Deltaproteobacteria bacterium]